MKKSALFLSATAGVAMAVSASVATAEKWDMPMAYAATNFHSEMGVVFADKVREYTGGDIDITVHAGGSLFKGGEIKRAIQTGQAPIGERFMSAHANEEAAAVSSAAMSLPSVTRCAAPTIWRCSMAKCAAEFVRLDMVWLINKERQLCAFCVSLWEIHCLMARLFGVLVPGQK